MGNVGGIAGQAVADVHHTADAVLGQDGSGVKSCAGLPKALHEFRKALIALLEGQPSAAGQSQRSGGVETLSGLGHTATREAIALPLADGEEIQRELSGARDITPAQSAAMPLQGLIKAVINPVDGGFG